MLLWCIARYLNDRRLGDDWIVGRSIELRLPNIAIMPSQIHITL